MSTKSLVVGRTAVFTFPQQISASKLTGEARAKELRLMLGTNYSYWADYDGQSGEVMSVNSEGRYTLRMDDGKLIEVFPHYLTIGPAPKPAKIAWEYKIGLGLNAGHMNELGKDGWELVAIAENIGAFWFKRPL